MASKNFFVVTESYLMNCTSTETANKFKEIFAEKGIDEALLLLSDDDIDALNYIANRNIKKLREQNGLTQSDLANTLCITQREYWRYEQDGYKISPNTLRILAAFYNVSLDWILGLIPEQKPIYTDGKVGYINEFSLDLIKHRKKQEAEEEEKRIQGMIIFDDSDNG